MSEWKPIESAPKDGTEVLISDGKRVVSAKYITETWDTWEEVDNNTRKRVKHVEGYWSCNITNPPSHWMPIPPPPKEPPND